MGVLSGFDVSLFIILFIAGTAILPLIAMSADQVNLTPHSRIVLAEC
jgi:hypothetical protein